MSNGRSPIIVVSTGRTGTIFFANLFNDLFPQVESYHERGWSRLLNVATNAHLDGILPLGALRMLWRRLKSRELQDRQKEFYVEVSNHLYGIVVLLPELRADLKVIHIVRDPRGYVRSHLNWARHRGKSYVANYLVPFWQPNPYLLKEMSLKEWLSLSKFESFCWIWDFKNRYVETLEKTEVPYLRIYFEDFFGRADPEVRLNQLLRFMELPEVHGITAQFKRPVNPTQTRTFPAWPNWEPGLCARLDQLCGAAMQRYGYGREAEWLEKVEIGRLRQGCPS